MQSKQDEIVINWLDSVAVESVWLTSITIFEAQYGLKLMPEGKRKKKLIALFSELIEKDLENRVLPFDYMASNLAAELKAKRHADGLNIEIRDTFIAGIVKARKATLATRNIKHFKDAKIALINPWDYQS